jgi:hypothetical protein
VRWAVLPFLIPLPENFESAIASSYRLVLLVPACQHTVHGVILSKAAEQLDLVATMAHCAGVNGGHLANLSWTPALQLRTCSSASEVKASHLRHCSRATLRGRRTPQPQRPLSSVSLLVVPSLIAEDADTHTRSLMSRLPRGRN